jgi:hypothetical protein
VLAGSGPYVLTDAYRARVRQLAAQQIALGGARLAAVLNRALTGSNIRSTH